MNHGCQISQINPTWNHGCQTSQINPTWNSQSHNYMEPWLPNIYNIFSFEGTWDK